MKNNRPKVAKHRLKRRGMALYLSVASTAMIVSVLGMSAMGVVRIERKQATGLNDRVLARMHARSAVELALKALSQDADWRDTYANGVETSAMLLGSNSRGSISWMLSDMDGDIADADRELWLKGIGRVGDAVQVSSVRVNAGETAGTLRSHSALLPGLVTPDELRTDRWWGQYFKPTTLPSDANGWRITQVDVYVNKPTGTNGRWFKLKLYAVGSDFLPNGTVIDSVDISSSSIPNGSGWFSVPLAGSTWLDKADAVMLALEQTSGLSAIRITQTSGVVGGNSALMRGIPNWDTWEPSRALQYRIHGAYTTNDEVSAQAGTWIWDSAP